jgi:hypothetical protein
VRWITGTVILMGIASSATAGEHYVEIWNPPEARASAPKPTTASKPAKRIHPAPRLAKTKVAHPAAVPTVAARPRPTHVDLRHPAPDVTDIPRQITPEGNVLRVDGRNAHVQVAR